MTSDERRAVQGPDPADDRRPALGSLIAEYAAVEAQVAEMVAELDPLIPRAAAALDRLLEAGHDMSDETTLRSWSVVRARLDAYAAATRRACAQFVQDVDLPIESQDARQ